MTEANKDEARKCLAIARQCIALDQLEKAEKFAKKAQRLYASVEAQSVLEALEAAKLAKHASSQNGPSTSGSNQHHAHANGHSNSRHQAHASGSQAHAGPNLPPKPARTAKPSAPIEDPGTPEQRELVAQVLKAKDYYAILGLAKDATDDDIKKAYRKLALKLHPDKNRALRSDDAFKAVSRSFNCLSDADKRAYYDRTGYENSSAAAAATAAQRGSGASPSYYYAASSDEFDPEEIFNMFFGGGFGGPQFRAQFGGMPRQRRHHSHSAQAGGGGQGGSGQAGASSGAGGGGPEQQQRAAMMGLLQLMPVLLILVFTFFQSSQSPPYSLVQDSSYRVEQRTGRLSVPFYVKSMNELERSYPQGGSARFRLERQVESAYYERLEARCQQERLVRHRAWSWGNREQARAMKLEACDEMDKVNEKLGMRRTAGY